MRDALILALHRVAKGGKTKQLNLVADALVRKAAEGDVAAIKEIFDRVDGKAIQQILGPEGGPIEIERTSDIELARRVVASRASELINEMSVVMSAGIGLASLAGVEHTYPAESGAIMLAAKAFVHHE